MLLILTSTLAVSSLYSGEKVVWKPVKFAILRFNDDAPASWNMYHGEKRGDLYFTKDMLLAVGDRYEKEIAANKEADARYR